MYFLVYFTYLKWFHLQREATIRQFQTSVIQHHDSLFVHRDSPEDNADTVFEFTTENLKVQFHILIDKNSFYSVLIIGFSLSALMQSWPYIPKDTNEQL